MKRIRSNNITNVLRYCLYFVNPTERRWRQCNKSICLSLTNPWLSVYSCYIIIHLKGELGLRIENKAEDRTKFGNLFFSGNEMIFFL